MTKNRSTGPRSEAGKARSSMNALKTGIYSKSLIIPGEDPADLNELIDEYYQRYLPFTPEQRDQLDILIRSTWTLRRLSVAETQVWVDDLARQYRPIANAPLGQVLRNCDRTLTRVQRMITATQRNYRDALRELERLLALDPDADPQEFVTYVPKPQPEPAPVTANSTQMSELMALIEETENDETNS